MTDEEPPKKPRVEKLLEKVAAVVLIVLGALGVLYLLDRTRSIRFDYIAATFPDLLEPALLTLLITVAGYFVGMGLGFLLGLLRTTKIRPVRAVATGWVEAIRGTPFLVQLLLLFAMFSFYNPGNLPTTTRVIVTGFLAMMINTSAYQAEIFRAGLQSVVAGQIEAAKAVGLGYWGSMRSVIMPQAFRIIIPPLTNEFILMLKASALLSLINVQELTYNARILSFVSGNLIEVYAMVTILYLLMTVPLAKVIAYLERRYRIPGLGLQQEGQVRRRKRDRSVVARVVGVGVLDGRPDSRRESRVTH